ncbi:uncharacterized protein LOC118268671 isoform X1 [Spodoptera frugiperda]|uniref:Uncharacterized protein LOC118268671 isoform X1 n=1 Tax=Spodoptera frugiperda TaxID=7108 RepID=A0A9R0D3R6_SPOFR|nr:uncharacterized protein LOC118268671 isoform X1 [Spodoptera frugiperda]
MPNTRRRRFSVQNEIAGRENKLQNGLPISEFCLHPEPNPTTWDEVGVKMSLFGFLNWISCVRHVVLLNSYINHSDPDSELKVVATNIVATKSPRPKSKAYANSSKSQTLEVVAECESSISVSTVKKQSIVTMDKAVYASSSTLITPENSTEECNPLIANRSKTVATAIETQKKRDERQLPRERAPVRRDKYPRQHRIKVRSPKRRIPIIEQPNNKAIESTKRTTGTAAINWDSEVELCRPENVTNVINTFEEVERTSNHSLDDMCRICHGGESLSPELGRLISACSCRGTVGRVHVKCLERWLTESGKSRCELCGTRYATRRVHRYGVPRALVMWVLSQNAKQLMVDSLGIMLMSPLAVLAAWLSGRTLAGLMTQESHVTPWPLASTFVLACMTLVCYYCWIVSAATRHALGWWIWYRSQYEVRLQIQDNED